MIKGIKFMDDRGRYYSQENNSVERFLKYEKANDGLNHWTESCGPTSAVRIMDGMGKLDAAKFGIKIQLEDYLWCALNDPGNDELFRNARSNLVPGSVPGNRVPQYYPAMVNKLFGVRAQYVEGITFVRLADELSKGNGVELCIVNPGHYIAAVGFDNERSEIIYDDPFPSRFANGDGWHRRMTAQEFAVTCREYGIIYLV